MMNLNKRSYGSFVNARYGCSYGLKVFSRPVLIAPQTCYFNLKYSKEDPFSPKGTGYQGGAPHQEPNSPKKEHQTSPENARSPSDEKPDANGSASRMNTKNTLLAEGEVRGFDSRMEQDQILLNKSYLIWSFRIEHNDGKGNRLPPESVQMRGVSFDGLIHNGDLIRVIEGEKGVSGIIAMKVHNLTTDTIVTAKQEGGDAPPWLLFVFLITSIIIALLFFGSISKESREFKERQDAIIKAAQEKRQEVEVHQDNMRKEAQQQRKEFEEQSDAKRKEAKESQKKFQDESFRMRCDIAKRTGDKLPQGC